MTFATDERLNVESASGPVVGAWADESRNIRVFRGLPYAEPPLGSRRFASPEPVTSWQESRNAGTFAAACPQPDATNAFVWSRDPFETSEVCLYLNIWSRADSDTAKPVMVWFHGGAHTTGFAHARIFDGVEFAANDVVLVTVNYRLGALGFLAHPLLKEANEGHAGNWGLMDKIQALKWIQSNIDAFGGDPGNVTIFGQSAGSQSVCSLMASPMARGLFHKAIGQSAACVLPSIEKDADGLVRGQRLIDTALDGRPATLDAMRSLAAEQLVSAQQASGWDQKSRITIDGRVLPEHPSQVFAQGRQAAIPLLVGSLANEGEQLFPVNHKLTDDELVAQVSRISSTPDELLALYANERARSPGHALHALLTDRFFALDMRSWADAQTRVHDRVYLYFMNHVPPAFKLYAPSNPELLLDGGPRSAGAYHSGDLAYVFGNTRKIGLHWNEDDHALSAVMIRYWTQFARTGNPNGEGLPAWPAYDPQRQATMVFDTPLRTENGVRREKLDALQQPR